MFSASVGVSRCMDGRQPVFDVVSVSVDVLRTDSKALLQLTSTTQLDREPRQLRITGAKLFFDLIITASLRQETSDQTMQYFDYQLAVGRYVHIIDVQWQYSG